MSDEVLVEERGFENVDFRGFGEYALLTLLLPLVDRATYGLPRQGKLKPYCRLSVIYNRLKVFRRPRGGSE